MSIVKVMKATALSAAIALSIGAGAQNVLTNRQQSLVSISSFGAKGDLKNLKQAFDLAFNEGFTQNELKDICCQLYAYAGFPRALNSLSALQTVIQERQTKGLPCDEGRTAVIPAGYEAIREGAKVQTSLFGPYTNTFCPNIDYMLKAHLFGDIFVSDLLTHKERELITISILASIEGVEPQLNAHLIAAQKTGITKEELHAFVLTLNDLGDDATAFRALKSVTSLYNEPVTEENPGLAFEMGEPNPYSKYFSGKSWLSFITTENENIANVTFEPGCRNNWHIHHGAGQILVCVDGEGWYQEWGQPARALKAGDIVYIKPEVKHWHGANKDCWFQHLSIEHCKSSEWLEPVSDEVYNNL